MLLVKTADVAANLNPDRVAHLDDATRERLDAKYTHSLGQLGIPRARSTTCTATPGESPVRATLSPGGRSIRLWRVRLISCWRRRVGSLVRGM